MTDTQPYKQVEKTIVYLTRGGHDHDGLNSTPVKIPNGTIVVEMLDSSLLALLTQARGGSSTGGFEVSFSQGATLVVGSSQRYYPKTGASLLSILFSLSVAGSSSTFLQVFVNGSLITPTNADGGILVSGSDINIPAGVNKGNVYFSNSMTTTDYIQLALSLAGTGAQNLDAQMRFG